MKSADLPRKDVEFFWDSFAYTHRARRTDTLKSSSPLSHLSRRRRTKAEAAQQTHELAHTAPAAHQSDSTSKSFRSGGEGGGGGSAVHWAAAEEL